MKDTLPVGRRHNLTVFDIVATATDNLGTITSLGVSSGSAPPFLAECVLPCLDDLAPLIVDSFVVAWQP